MRKMMNHRGSFLKEKWTSSAKLIKKREVINI